MSTSKHDHDREEGLAFQPKFDASGLVTCVATDAATGDVLMVAHMNDEALRKTIASGEAWYFSRSRNALWRKGETSGQTQRVVEMRMDCDQDAVWIRVEQTRRRLSHRPALVLLPQGRRADGDTRLSFVDADRLFDPDESLPQIDSIDPCVNDAALGAELRCLRWCDVQKFHLVVEMGQSRWRIEFFRQSPFLASIVLPFGRGASADHAATARHHGRARARLRLMSRRGRRGHQRRLFSAAGGQARGLSLQSAGGVQGRAAQIPADELSAGFSARPLSKQMAEHFASLRPPFPPPAVPTVSNEILARGESIAVNGDPQRGVPACASCHGPTFGGMEPAIPGSARPARQLHQRAARRLALRHADRRRAGLHADRCRPSDRRRRQGRCGLSVVASRADGPVALPSAAACRCRWPAAASRTEGRSCICREP